MVHNGFTNNSKAELRLEISGNEIPKNHLKNPILNLLLEFLYATILLQKYT